MKLHDDIDSLSPEDSLEGTPYLIPEDAASRAVFYERLDNSKSARRIAALAMQQIARDAQEMLTPFIQASVTDLVTESNEMEHMEWPLAATREIVAKHRELLDGPIHTLTRSIESDPKVYEVLGLYKAHEIAHEWREKSDRAPMVHEIRQLQKVIVGDVYGAGSFKEHSNRISGTDHKPAEPFDVARVMLELSDWWQQGSGDPILTATVVHAWIAHIHPFDDGNGRTARVLANLELARHGYPPLIIRPSADRKEYYEALAASDQGDILPLYDLFTRNIRNQARLMRKPNYVRDIIEDKFLSDNTARYSMWDAVVSKFRDRLAEECGRVNWTFELSGMSNIQNFSLLGDRDSSGNSWFCTVGPSDGRDEWLLWFGYQSDEYRRCLSAPSVRPFPSIFVSRRDTSPNAEKPFLPSFPRPLESSIPDEISVGVEVAGMPIEFRWDSELDNFTITAAAEDLINFLVEHSTRW